MIRLLALLFLFCSGFAASPAEPIAAPGAADPKVLKAFDAWLKAYRSGKVDLASDADIEKSSVAKRYDLLPMGLIGRVTALRELEILLDAAVALGNAEAAERVLAVAAIGFDRGKYTREMAPALARSLGAAALIKFQDPAARNFVIEVARGTPAKFGSKELDKAAMAAALTAIGAWGDLAHRPTLEQGLRAPENVVRLAAAEGLRALRDRAAFDALAQSLERETSEPVIQSLVTSLDELLSRDAAGFSDDQRRFAVRAAVAALGKSGWRGDLSLVGFLEKHRSGEAVPALIDVLDRFVQHPEQVRSGELSGILRHRVHEVLISLTGAIFPIDAITEWRAFWEREKDRFKVADAPKSTSDKTVAQGFFGIPVQGTRVLFIVDVSGSMNFSIPPGGTTGELPDEMPVRLDVAKRELLRAVAQLPDEASFNVVTFSQNASTWQKQLVPADRKNRDAFKKYVENLRADGGTNVWAGMQEALKIKSLTYGDRYESHADEVFILSDGLPSVGEVIDPKEILRLIAETNRFAQMRINTVYISGEPNERERQEIQRAGMSGQELMKAIAEQNGGRYVERRTAN